jgi:hypothetical protein
MVGGGPAKIRPVWRRPWPGKGCGGYSGSPGCGFRVWLRRRCVRRGRQSGELGGNARRLGPRADALACREEFGVVGRRRSRAEGGARLGGANGGATERVRGRQRGPVRVSNRPFLIGAHPSHRCNRRDEGGRTTHPTRRDVRGRHAWARPPRRLGARDLGARGVGMRGTRGPDAEAVGRHAARGCGMRALGARRCGGGTTELDPYFF